MKNCWPVLSKNLLPLVEIVGIAVILATRLRTKAAPAKMLETILSDTVEIWMVKSREVRGPFRQSKAGQARTRVAQAMKVEVEFEGELGGRA